MKNFIIPLIIGLFLMAIALINDSINPSHITINAIVWLLGITFCTIACLRHSSKR